MLGGGGIGEHEASAVTGGGGDAKRESTVPIRAVLSRDDAALSGAECVFVEDFPVQQLPPLQFGQPCGIRGVEPLGLYDVDLGVDDRLGL
jgi:hypothetical protein